MFGSDRGIGSVNDHKTSSIQLVLGRFWIGWIGFSFVRSSIASYHLSLKVVSFKFKRI